MLKVLSETLWRTIRAKARRSRTRRAAIAYVGESPPISFGRGDVLIVDASDASIKCGRTNAKTLKAFRDSGAELFCQPDLHAKVMLLDDWAVIGSTNDSRHSLATYVEAAIVTDRPDVAGQVERLITHLASISQRIDSRFLRHILSLPVTRASPLPGHPRRKRARSISRGPRAWVVSLRGEASYPGDEDQVEAISKEEQRKVNRRSGKVDWFFWSGNGRFPSRANVGDIIIECWRPRLKFTTTRSVKVYRHGRLVRIFREPGVKARTFHCLWPSDHERTALPWSDFARLASRAGLKRRLSPRSTIELSEQQSAVLHELWPR